MQHANKILILPILKRLYDDNLKIYLSTHKVRLFLILFIIILSVILISFSPLAIARLLKSLSIDKNRFTVDVMLCLSTFILLRFLGSIIIDLRWILINPFFYKITYDFSRSLVRKINTIFKNELGVNENASLISERIAVISKMQIGLMGILYHLVSVIFSAILEITIVLVIVYLFIGPVFIFYFLIGALVLFFSTSFQRTKEVENGKSAYQADNNVLSFCGEMITNAKLSREMKGHKYFNNVLNELIEKAVSEYQNFFFTRFKRSAYLTVSITISYIMVFYGQRI